MFRRRKDHLQVFLVHPGGPFWKNKDAGAWSIPKGEYGEKEDPVPGELLFGVTTGHVALLRPKRPNARLNAHLCSSSQYR
jgi:hypothetical protein